LQQLVRNTLKVHVQHGGLAGASTNAVLAVVVQRKQSLVLETLHIWLQLQQPTTSSQTS
jgi:hypothetical protein